VIQSRNIRRKKSGREAMAESQTIDPCLVAEIVGSYVSHNNIAAGELPNLIATIHRSLAELGKPAGMPAPTPAVAINRSYSEDFVVCLDCGWRGGAYCVVPG
jgi:predicted transcriptional regulator